MKLQRRRTKKLRGNYSRVLHYFLITVLPILAYVMVRLDFAWIAVALVLLSKWRIFSVKPRHWLANLRVNAVDIFVGLSLVTFMIIADSQAIQLLWVVLYEVWLLYVKPKSTTLWIGLQALIAQTVGLIAVFLFWAEAPTLTLVFLTWGVTYFTSRHFLAAFDESMSQTTAYAWAFFASSIAWLSGHWLIFYGPVAQPAVLLSTLGYGLASIYYLDHTDRLTGSVRRQFVALMAIMVMVLIVFSDWSDKTV